MAATRLEQTPLRIRRARPGEAGALTALAFRSKAVWGYDAAFLRDAAPDLTVTERQLAKGHIYVATREGAVLGFYGLTDEDGAPELDFLFVEPAAMRQGIGARLLRHAVKQAARLGWSGFNIVSDPQAVAFYERCGALRVGEVPSPVRPGRKLPLLRMETHPRALLLEPSARPGKSA